MDMEMGRLPLSVATPLQLAHECQAGKHQQGAPFMQFYWPVQDIADGHSSSVVGTCSAGAGSGWEGIK